MTILFLRLIITNTNLSCYDFNNKTDNLARAISTMNSRYPCTWMDLSGPIYMDPGPTADKWGTWREIYRRKLRLVRVPHSEPGRLPVFPHHGKNLRPDGQTSL